MIMRNALRLTLLTIVVSTTTAPLVFAQEPTTSKAVESRADVKAVTPEEIPKGRVLKRRYRFEQAGKDMEYTMYVPKSYDGSKPMPLIVALHGLWSTPEQIIGYPGFVQRAEKQGYVIVAPMGYNKQGWYGAMGPNGGVDPKNLGELSETDVLNVLEIARRKLKIDDRRIYLYGHSMGGGGALHLATKYPKKWAAVAMVAPAAYFSRDRLKTAKSIPMIVVQGTRDKLVAVGSTQAWVAKMKELEMKHRYIEVANGGHVFVAWQHFDDIFGFYKDHPRPETIIKMTDMLPTP